MWAALELEPLSPPLLATSCAQLRLRGADNSIRSLSPAGMVTGFLGDASAPATSCPGPDAGSPDAPTLMACPHWPELP